MNRLPVKIERAIEYLCIECRRDLCHGQLTDSAVGRHNTSYWYVDTLQHSPHDFRLLGVVCERKPRDHSASKPNILRSFRCLDREKLRLQAFALDTFRLDIMDYQRWQVERRLELGVEGGGAGCASRASRRNLLSADNHKVLILCISVEAINDLREDLVGLTARLRKEVQCLVNCDPYHAIPRIVLKVELIRVRDEVQLGVVVLPVRQ